MASYCRLSLLAALLVLLALCLPTALAQDVYAEASSTCQTDCGSRSAPVATISAG
jgi:hypothetical protein